MQYVGHMAEQGEGLLAKFLDRPELIKDVLNLVSRLGNSISQLK
jgi:hypothetical protein